MQSIDDLVGSAKHASDLTSKSMRVRYTLASSVNSGAYHRHTFPRMPDMFLDSRSIKMRFQLRIVSTDPLCCIDAPTALSLFSRIRVLSGSQVVMDVVNNNIYTTLDENINGSSVYESRYEKYLRGHGNLAERRAWASGEREYIFHFNRNSILNTSALLPLSKMSDLHIELFNADGKDVLHSPAGDVSCGFVMSDLELHCNYLSSKSISAYFQTRPLAFHVQEVSHRHNNVVGMTSLLKFSSAHSSLAKIVTLLRSSDTLAVNFAERASRSITAQSIDKYDLFINSVRLYDIPIDSVEQMWKHVIDALPGIRRSEWFDQEYEGSKFLLVNNLNSAPTDFQDSILSGIKTSAHNSDTALQIQFRAVPVNVIADSFLLADGLITLGQGKSDLTLSY